MRGCRGRDDDGIEPLEFHRLACVAHVPDSGHLAESGANQCGRIDDRRDFDAIEAIGDGQVRQAHLAESDNRDFDHEGTNPETYRKGSRTGRSGRMRSEPSARG